MVSPLAIKGQATNFSQFYSTPTLLGPSFAGMNKGSRVAMNYRRQWISIPNSYRTYSVSFDHYLEDMNSGLGFLAMRDASGAGDLSLTNLSLLYSYDLEISRTWHFRPGIQFMYSHRSMNFREFTFGDQLSLDGDNAPVTIEEDYKDYLNYLDGAASALFYNDQFWFGFSAKHLLQPNQSFLGGNTHQSKVSMKFSGYGGVMFDLSDRRSKTEENFRVTFLYENKPKEGWDHLDLGVYYTKEPLMIGSWVRGLPGINSPQGYEMQNIDAVIIMAGVKFSKFRIGYSYDFTVSKLWNSSTGGTHEVSIVYRFMKEFSLRRREKHTSIACPSF